MKIITILLTILTVLALGFNFYILNKCWNIPIAERTGICALRT